MSSMPGFEPVTEVAADGRARVAFGRVGVRQHDRFLVSKHPGGEIMLTPLASIPKQELLVWENEQVGASLPRGIADSLHDRVRPLDDFLDEDIQE
jgi:hypothetical protein